MKEEIKGAKELINIPEVKNGNYSFIGDSNITYADIRNLIDYIKQLETNWKELKEWLHTRINTDYDYAKYFQIKEKLQVEDCVIKQVLFYIQELENSNNE